MAKHGKNRTANPVYSQGERDKDKALSGWGTQKRRAGADSLPAFDCCSLSTLACKIPVITPGGHLFDKEFILENLLRQKADMKRKTKEYEAQQRRIAAEDATKAGAAEAKATAKFLSRERGVTTQVGNHFVESAPVEISQAGKMLAMKPETLQTEQGKVVPKLPAYWLPSLGPEAKEAVLKAPSTKTVCPMSGKNLRSKDLIPVNFKLADQHSTQALVAREERFVCALTDKLLRNCVPCVVLRPTGRVITKEAYERLVKPDMLEPITGQKLKAKDIIPMQSSGTGFASGGAEIKKLKTSVAHYA